MNQWTICGYSVARGEKKQVLIEPGVAGYEMPATLIYGNEDGPTIVVTAGIHSGEYPGVAAAIRVAAEINPIRVKGRILLLHCVNTSGFWAKSPDRVPEDGANLNANYPGSPDGGTGDRIADYFVREIFPQAGFIIDLHSGGQMEPLTPCLFFPAAAGEEVHKTSEAAARATDIPYLIASTAATGQYSYAAKLGIPGLLLERGYCGYCKEAWVQAYQKDIRLLFNHLGVYVFNPAKPVCDKKVYNKTIYLAAAEAGLWYPAIEENGIVKKGDLLGHTENFFGKCIREYYAEEDGTVFYYTSGLAVNPGDPLVAYGLEKFAQK